MQKNLSQPGKLDERVTFKRYTQVSDGGGGFTNTWTNYHACAAKVKALSGSERDVAAQTQAPRNYRLWVRRCSETAGLTEADIVVWRGKAMQIRFIRDDGPRPLYMEIEAEAGVNIQDYP